MMKKSDGATKSRPGQLSFRTLYWIWFATLVLFIATAIHLNGTNLGSESVSIVVLLITVLVGVVSYLALGLSLLENKGGKHLNKYRIATAVTFVGFIFLVFNLNSVLAKVELISRSNSKSQQVDKKVNTNPATPRPTPRPSAKPVQYDNSVTAPDGSQIDCTGPDGKVFKTTQKDCDEFNSAWDGHSNEDEIVDCQLSINSYRLSRKDCEYYQAQASKYDASDWDYIKPAPSAEPVPNYIYTYQAPALSNLELQQSCIGDAKRIYESELRDLKNSVAAHYGGSAYIRAENRINSDYAGEVAYCKSRYPTSGN